MNVKFAVIYSFKVKEGQEEVFQQNWKALTELIYKFEGSLGSRLHKADGQLYIAYAIWPTKEQWERSGSNLPDHAEEVRNLMKESCEEIKTQYELEMIEDLLMPTSFKA